MTHTALTIAVIDDDGGVRVALQELLRAADFDALGFSSAEEFLAARDVRDVHCLIVDVNLPGMSGVALMQALAAAGRRVPAVLISARDDPTTRALVRTSGPIPFLRKPFSDSELLAAIVEAVRREHDTGRA